MIEILEPRIAPAAIINIIAKNGSAMLKVDGKTDGAESIVITGLGDGRLMIEGTNGEMFHLGNNTSAGPITLDEITQDLSVDLGKGSDSLTMGGLQLGGKLTLKLGDGDNTTQITNAIIGGSVSYTGTKGMDKLTAGGNVFSIGGTLTFTGGAGDNKLQISATDFSDAGTLTYDGGKDADTLAMNSTHVNITGALNFLAGSGANNLTYVGDGFHVGKNLLFLSGKNLTDDVSGLGIASIGVTHIGGLLTYTNPTGRQVFGINGAGVEIGGPTFINASPSNDSQAGILGTNVTTKSLTVASTSGAHLSFALNATTLNVGGAVIMRGLKNIQITGGGAISGSLTLSAATGLAMANVSGPLVVSGPVAYKSNSALDSTVMLQGVVFAGATTFNLRQGIDTVQIERSSFLKSFTMDAGTGNDVIKIETLADPGTTIFAGAVAINLGSGADSLTSGSMDAKDKLTALKKFVVTGGNGGGDVVSLLNGTNVFVVPPVVH